MINKNRIIFGYGIIALLLMQGCISKGVSETTSPLSSTIQLTNTSDEFRQEVVEIDNPEILESQFLSLKVGQGKVGSQSVECFDTDRDGLVDKIALKVSLKANETVSLDFKNYEEINASGEKRTQAELSIKTGGTWNGRKYEGGDFMNVSSLRVPDQHTDHSYFIRYEGPGLENESVGYRFYLDWRNAIDVFGKKVDTLVLQTVGQDGFDSYHEASPWGMDVLKAGKSLGVGSIGQFIDNQVEHFQQVDSVYCKVLNNGNLISAIETNYYGWQTSADVADLTSVLSISTGDRAVRHDWSFTKPIQNFCTGIVKNKNAERIESLVGSNGWAYIATYGKQSLAEDNLGLAIIYNTKDVEYISDSGYDHLIVFKPTTEKVSYYLLGAWEQEKNGISDQTGFQNYLNTKIQQLNNPVTVAFL